MGWWTVDFATLGRVVFYTIISVKTKQVHLLTLHLENHETMAKIWLPSVIARSKEERGTRTNSWNAFWPLSVLSFDNHYCYLQTCQYGGLWNKPLQAALIVLFFLLQDGANFPTTDCCIRNFRTKQEIYAMRVYFSVAFMPALCCFIYY